MPRQNALEVVREYAGTVFRGFLLGDRDLTPVGNPTLEDAVACTLFLVHMDCRIDLWIGRLLIKFEGCWGKKYVRVVEATGLSYGMLRNIKSVVSRVGDRWNHALGFAHYEHIAPLPPEVQQRLIDQAVQENWSESLMEQKAYMAGRPAASLDVASLPPNPHLYHGDCCEILPRLPDRSVHFLLTDPPYGLGYSCTTRIVPFAPILNDDDIETATSIVDKAFATLASKLIPNCYVCVFNSMKTVEPMLQVVARYFTVEDVIYWIKNAWGTGNVYANYGDQDELIILAYNGPERSVRRAPRALYCDRIGTNQRRHQAQKPVAILRTLIETFTDIGDVVLDPFMGTGSTIVAARNAGRQYEGIEIDEGNYTIARQRLADPMSND